MSSNAVKINQGAGKHNRTNVLIPHPERGDQTVKGAVT